MNDYFVEYKNAYDVVIQAWRDLGGPYYTEEQLESTDQDLVETEKRFLDFEAGLKHPESV